MGWRCRRFGCGGCVVGVLGQIAQVFPLQHLLLAARAAYAPVPGAGFPWWHVAVVAGWGVAGFGFALRFFRWTARP
jgi:hypothetical protein